MPNISTMKASRFLKRDDVGKGTLVTIDSVSQENIAKEGAPEELKWCVHFREIDKPMVANFTNLQLIARACGSEESEDWEGKQVVLYDDPNVSFGGKLVGGIRVRAPKAGTKTKPVPDPAEEEEESPF